MVCSNLFTNVYHNILGGEICRSPVAVRSSPFVDRAHETSGAGETYLDECRSGWSQCRLAPAAHASLCSLNACEWQTHAAAHVARPDQGLPILQHQQPPCGQGEPPVVLEFWCHFVRNGTATSSARPEKALTSACQQPVAAIAWSCSGTRRRVSPCHAEGAYGYQEARRRRARDTASLMRIPEAESALSRAAWWPYPVGRQRPSEDTPADPYPGVDELGGIHKPFQLKADETDRPGLWHPLMTVLLGTKLLKATPKAVDLMLLPASMAGTKCKEIINKVETNSDPSTLSESWSKQIRKLGDIPL